MYRDNESRIIGKRIVCSNRYGHKGCGRTRQLYLKDVIPRLHYRLFVFITFIEALLAGDLVDKAYLKAIGSLEKNPRHAWRWLQKLMRQLPLWRNRVSHADEDFSVSQRSPTLNILLPTVKQIFWPLPTIQYRFQQPLV